MGQRVHLLRFCKILESIIVNEELLGTWSEKKRDFVGKFPSGGLPHLPPPVWETPVIKKKLGLFFILGPQEHFWSSPKNQHFG